MADKQGAKLTAKTAAQRELDGRLESAHILAVDSSSRDAAIAALEGNGDTARVFRETALASDRRTAQVLVPGILELLDGVGWTPGDVQLVAVVVGPGSFTGLRIGVTFAKTFAYATGADVIGVDALAAIAHQTPAGDQPLWAVLDAQRQELFAARYECVDKRWSPSVATHIVPQDDWLSKLQSGERVSGPALRKLRDRLPAGIEVVDESLWQPRAGVVGQLGWSAHRAGRRDDLWSLAPHYYRASAAEEKRAQRDGSTI